jgi:hypothetical protein
MAHPSRIRSRYDPDINPRASSDGGDQPEAVCEMLRFVENNRTTLTGISVKELTHEGHDL